MKVALNNRNVILSSLNHTRRASDCVDCCFLSNWALCGVLALRDDTICRTVKIFDDTELKEVFKL